MEILNQIPKIIVADKRPLLSDSSFKLFFDQFPHALSIYSEKGSLIYYNRAFLNLHGIAKEEISDFTSAYNLFEDPYFQECRKDILHVFRSGRAFRKAPGSLSRKTSDHHISHSSKNFFPLKSKNAKIREIILMEEDDHHLIKDNFELSKKLEDVYLLKEAYDISSIIAEVNSYGSIIRANKQFFEVSGYSEKDIPELTFRELRSGNMHPAIYENLANAIRQGKTWKGELENRTKKGIIFWTETTIVPLKSERKSSFLCISSNITERKLAENKISRLNKGLEKEVAKRTADINLVISELEAFTYSVSHDLRAPLRAITGFSGMLKEEFAHELNEEAIRYLKIIESGTKQMSQLIDDLLQFSKVGRISLKKTIFHPKVMINDIIAKAKELSDKDFETEMDDLPPIYGDPTMIRLVFTNLILNAIKFSSMVDRPKIKIGAIAGSEEVVYYIKDNGVGFDMRYYDKLFKVFQRLHSVQQFEGTGVGLAIVSRIIHKHEGRVWGESIPEKKTVFYFSLPNKKKNEPS